MLSQFRMVVFSKWRMTHNTYKHNQTGDVNALYYDAVTSQGFECKFTPDIQGLQAYKVNHKNRNKLFGSKVHDNGSMFGGTYHAVTESDGQDRNAVTFEEIKF